MKADCWKVSLREGRHEGLITLETFKRNQARRTQAAKAPARKNIGDAFALRGFVTCACCDVPLRSCLSKSGTGRRYAYYLCQTKDCDHYGKSIPRDRLEGDFEDILKGLRPSAPLIEIIRKMFLDAWTQRQKQAKAAHTALKRSHAKLARKIDDLLDRIAEAPSPIAMHAYERKIATLEEERLLIDEQLAGSRHKYRPNGPEAQEKLELALTFLSNPWKLWTSGDSSLRRTVLRLTFADRLPYCRNQGPKTPKTTMPFNRLGGNLGGKEELVPVIGLEPTTPSLRMTCSTS